MSFASDVRGELARQPHHDICCARSELAAALLASGGISYRGRNRYSLSITATDAPVVRRYFAILKQFWGVIGQIRTLSADALNGLVRYQLIIPDESALMLLEELSLLDESALFGVRQLPREELVRFACCKKAFVRAAFLMCGAVNNPEKDYH
ncbi:MAG: DNA-binding protein WhiA [Clostridia bacterium]|nr:DNA-binding protein WhiA [Clostridia bacterium]